MSHFGMSLKHSFTVKNKSHAFAPIHKQPFPVPHYCGTGDLPDCASATPHSAHWTQVDAVIFYGACGLSTLLSKILSG